METDKDLQEAAEQEAKREGSAAGLLAGLLILVLLVGSAFRLLIFGRYSRSRPPSLMSLYPPQGAGYQTRVMMMADDDRVDTVARTLRNEMR